MAKDPVMPLYYNDILGSTKTWTDEEFGAYVRLLIEQWDKGSIPKEAFRLNKIAETAEKNWQILKDKFIEKDGKIFNENMELIREKKAKFSKHQKENVTKRYTKTLPEDYQTSTKKLPLEIEIEKEKEIEIEKEYGLYYVDEKFKKCFILFLIYRKEIGKKYKSARSVKGCYSNLIQLSNNDELVAEQIIQRTINNQWQGLFPLNKNGKSNTEVRTNRVNEVQNVHNLSERILDNHQSKNSGTGS